MERKLTIRKEDVMREVAVTTAYTGGKMEGDENAFDRISTVDEDENHLERFWEECRADLCQELIGIIEYEGMMPDAIISPVIPGATEAASVSAIGDATATAMPRHYEVRLNVSRSFDDAQLPSMRLSLFSFFVHGITAKWYIYTNKQEAGEYADKASTLLDDIHRKAVYKKKPTRPTYDD